jgi:hypothetical protein
MKKAVPSTPQPVESAAPAGQITWPSFADDPEGATKTLLQDLIFRSELYPELAQHLAPAIQTLEISLRRTPKTAAERILKLLELSTGMTLDELQEDMVLPVAKIRELLDGLINEKKVEQVTTGRRIDPRKGRIEYYFIIFGRKLGSAYSAPAPGNSSTKAFMDSLSAEKS